MSTLGRASTEGGGVCVCEGGSETGSGFFKGVGGESGTRVMSLLVGPRPHPSRRTPPQYTYTYRFRCASSHVTGNPRNPPLPRGVGATWAVGNRVAPAGKGHRGYGSHERGATRTTVRNF